MANELTITISVGIIDKVESAGVFGKHRKRRDQVHEELAMLTTTVDQALPLAAMPKRCSIACPSRPLPNIPTKRTMPCCPACLSQNRRHHAAEPLEHRVHVPNGGRSALRGVWRRSPRDGPASSATRGGKTTLTLVACGILRPDSAPSRRPSCPCTVPRRDRTAAEP